MSAAESTVARGLRSLLWPAVMTAIALPILLGLGVWQLERLAWKEGLIASINAGLDKPPAPLEQPPDAWKTLATHEYLPVLVTGRFRHADERHLFTSQGGETGWHIYTPLETEGGHVVLVNRGFVPDRLKDPATRPAGQVEGAVTVTGRFRHGDERHLFTSQGGETGWHIYTPLETEGGNVVLVNRGFVPDRLKDPATRPAGQVEGPVTVTGLLRKPVTHGWFEPEADRARNMWYWRDLDGFKASLAPGVAAERVLPLFVDAAAEPANPGGWPKGGATRLDIPNRHLEYALTWFGLAATLVAVFAAFAWTRLRSAA